MAQIKFTVDKVKGAIEKSKKLAGGGGQDGDYANLAYMPEGTHKIRWFFDPEGEIKRLAVIHMQSGKRCLCPQWLIDHGIPIIGEKDGKPTESFDYPECEICDLSGELDEWRIGQRWTNIAYGYLFHTNVPSDYWQPGNAYAILGNNKMGNAIINSLEALVEDSEEWLMQMLNPQIAGGLTTVQYVKGSQGSCSITPIVGKTIDPIELGDWWKPLNEVYVNANFSVGSYRSTAAAIKREWLGDHLQEMDEEAVAAYIAEKGIDLDPAGFDDLEALKNEIRKIENAEGEGEGDDTGASGGGQESSADDKTPPEAAEVPAMPEGFLEDNDRNKLLIRIRDNELGFQVFPRFDDATVRQMIWTMECQKGIQPAEWEKSQQPAEEPEKAEEVAEQPEEIAETPESPEEPKEVAEAPEEPAEVAEEPEQVAETPEATPGEVPEKAEAPAEEPAEAPSTEASGDAPEWADTCKHPSGWGHYDPAQACCIVCPSNLECMELSPRS